MRSFLLILLPLIGMATPMQKAQLDTVLMGSAFSFTALHENKIVANQAVQKAMLEVIRIESKISSWQRQSETSLINKSAGIKPVEVSNELIQLIERSIKLSRLSNGYFDISFASIKPVWDFKNHNAQLPSKKQIQASVALINYKDIVTTDSTVFLKKKGMKIDFGAIGKGYAANMAKSIMVREGILNGVVNAGGDLINWGTNLQGKPWGIGIASPSKKGELISWLNTTNKSVVTSGNYEKFVMINGKRYCHIINPKTGWPVQGLKSVTIITTDAELADALATTVFVLGPKEGMLLINHLKGVECFMIDDKNNLLYSKNLRLNKT